MYNKVVYDSEYLVNFLFVFSVLDIFCYDFFGLYSTVFSENVIDVCH